MARVTLDRYDRYPFEITLAVRVSDLNHAGHLGHDRLINLAQQARGLLLHGWGLDELDLGDGRTGLVIADVAAVFDGEAFLHDELVFGIRVVHIGGRSLRLAYQVRRPDGRAVARLETGLVVFDYQQRQAVPMPDRLRGRLVELEQAGG